jgi:hypothetical protein
MRRSSLGALHFGQSGRFRVFTVLEKKLNRVLQWGQ